MATFVLVHGGGHGGWCYRFVARLLRAEGHEVHTPTLTGLAERAHLVSADVDLDLHITDVERLLEIEDLHDVILVGHSYGGMVITGAADRCPSRIVNLVYLDAAYPGDGQALVDIAAPMMEAARAEGRVVDGVELVLFPGSYPMTENDWYGVTDPDRIAWMKPKLTPHPWRCFAQPLRLRDEAALRRIPISMVTTAIQAEQLTDEIVAAMEEMTEGRYWHVDTGHDLMISEPEQTAAVLHALAAQYPGG